MTTPSLERGTLNQDHFTTTKDIFPPSVEDISCHTPPSLDPQLVWKGKDGFKIAEVALPAGTPATGNTEAIANSLFTEYLLPRFTNIRRVFVDNSTTPVTFWVGNNHGASIIKLEPLDEDGR